MIFFLVDLVLLETKAVPNRIPLQNSSSDNRLAIVSKKISSEQVGNSKLFMYRVVYKTYPIILKYSVVYISTGSFASIQLWNFLVFSAFKSINLWHFFQSIALRRLVKSIQWWNCSFWNQIRHLNPLSTAAQPLNLGPQYPTGPRELGTDLTHTVVGPCDHRSSLTNAKALTTCGAIITRRKRERDRASARVGGGGRWIVRIPACCWPRRACRPRVFRACRKRSSRAREDSFIIHGAGPVARDIIKQARARLGVYNDRHRRRARRSCVCLLWRVSKRNYGDRRPWSYDRIIGR